MKQTIKSKVEQILLKQGYIDNFFAIDTRLTLRLSDVIFQLSQSGWSFDEEKSGYIGDTKNWRYVVKTSPWKVQKITLGNGEVIEKLVK